MNQKTAEVSNFDDGIEVSRWRKRSSKWSMWFIQGRIYFQIKSNRAREPELEEIVTQLRQLEFVKKRLLYLDNKNAVSDSFTVQSC